LPGIYTPEVYIDRLDQFRLMAANLGRMPPQEQDAWVKNYHKRAVEAKEPYPVFFVDPRQVMPVGKGRIERPTERILAQGQLPNGSPPNGNPFAQPQPPNAPVILANGPPAAPPPVAGWKELVQDTELNERTRRLQIHEILAKTGLVAPEKVLRPIYKDV